MKSFFKFLSIIGVAIGTVWLLGRAAEIERKSKRIDRTIDVWSKLP